MLKKFSTIINKFAILLFVKSKLTWNCCSTIGSWLPMHRQLPCLFLLSYYCIYKRHAMPHKGLKLPKRFINHTLDSRRCQGEKRRSCIKRKRKIGIKLKFCIFYMSSLFHLRTHNLSRRQKKHATLCSEVCEPFRRF